MHESADTTSSSVPPRLVLSRPARDGTNIATSSNSRNSRTANKGRAVGPSPTVSNGTDQGVKDRGSTEWFDVDDDKENEPRTRRRRKAKRNDGHESSRSRKLDEQSTASNISTDSSVRFLPRLSQILESSETGFTLRPSSKGSDDSRHSDRTSTRRTRHREGSGVTYRRAGRKVGVLQRRQEPVFRVNPSLLSVLSGLTSASDRSSGSGSTITQQSYDRHSSQDPRPSFHRPRQAESEVGSIMDDSRAWRRSPSAFDYMQDTSRDDVHDTRSVVSSCSSSSSQYQPSDASLSDAPTTPSSRSTFPSPTQAYGSSVAELRRKYDQSLASHNFSRSGSDGDSRCSTHSPDPVRHPRKQSSGHGVAEHDTSTSYDEAQREHQSYRRGSTASDKNPERLKEQEEHLHEHMTYSQHAQSDYPIGSNYDQHHHASETISQNPEYAAQAYQMAMQQYQYQQSPAPQPRPDLAHHIETTPSPQQDRPPAPEAPDITRPTLVGYERVAFELASTTSPVQPLYRKFTYLNHRLLLHLQDELSELEEQLRTLDEVIAHLDPALTTVIGPEGPSQHHSIPASRRREAYHGTDIHHRRTNLLGCIFFKMEQYNKALAAFAAMLKDCSPAEQGQVDIYRAWLAEHAPIHERETAFLNHDSDLVSPGDANANTSAKSPSKQQQQQLSAGAHIDSRNLPIGLALPILLFALIPTFADRLLVTLLVAAAMAVVAASSEQIRGLLPLRDWMVCAAVYVLLMAAVASCVPQH